ncbi:hypothetical protein BTUL_0201g00180 [Botrytis tulipae]|uniref:Peptidase S53 domain-containing protein n=1 Tax=Botrytis tulipae TaxID=87230 RepID=A0A4Z1EE34_9HELO|nr:hypothetical protein BTUL_0201g00180 [Botrytis tulipae]
MWRLQIDRWEQLSTPDPQQLPRFHIALRSQNTDIFEQTLLNISSPDNVFYGQHMSRNEVETMLKADEESRTTVWSWLLDAGIPSGNVTDKGDWLQITTRDQVVEAMLNNTFFWVRTLQYSVPKNVAAHINVIRPTTRFGQMSPQSIDTLFCLPKSALQDTYRHIQTPDFNRTFCNNTIIPKCMANRVHVTEFITSGLATLVPDYEHPSLHGSTEPCPDLLRYLLRLPNEELPSTISVSYGEDEQTVPKSYARQTCFMIAQFGARGTSVIVASADKGVASVGVVRYIDPEQAVYFSSGGFSDHWPRPSYQQKAVEDFLQTQLSDRQRGLFDPHGRAFPDVSAQSVRYIIADVGHMIYEGGTRCAAPTFAGIIGLLNDARISSHLPPFGF